MEHSSTTNPLWDFSVSLYKQPGVVDYCISLQDKYDALINLVLFCCWLGSRQRGLARHSLKQAEQLIFDYNLKMTKPIRLRRKQLSRKHADYETLKTQLLEQELCAERQEQDKLYTWFLQAALPAGTPPSDKCCEDLIVANLQCYLDKLDPALVCPPFLVDVVLKYSLDGRIE